MGLYTKLPNNIDEVDVIIAGGGTAACVVAGRLAEADPKLSILVIEGGQDNRGKQSVEHPIFYLDNLLPTSTTAIFYQANESKNLAGRAPIVPSGGTLGGGSSINFMLYTRAQRSDFDSWNTPGWSADEIFPFLKKLETYHGRGKPEHHGYEGPVQITDGTWRNTRAEDDYLNAAAKVGWPDIPDLQNLDANNGFERWLRTVSKEGRRQDTATAYLHSKIDNPQYPNVHILTESKVVRVLLDDEKRAVGVEYTPNIKFQPIIGPNQPPKMTVKARRQVVISCGACGTPSVLERSGIGNPEYLNKAGVPVLVDLPGVGHDYQDHNLTLWPYRTGMEPYETMDAVYRNPEKRQELIDSKHKIVGWNGVDLSSKLRPTDEDVAALGPEFQAAWDRDFKNAPDRPIMHVGVVSCYLGDMSTIPEGQYLTMANYTSYPYSRGHLHITGPSVDDPLDFNTGFLSDEHDLDLKKQVWAYKKSREIMRRMTTYRGEVAVGHPAYPAGSKAACVEGALSEAVEADIQYTPEDDKAIEQSIRETLGTTWHSIGTCKMAPKEEKGVVDARLNVWGTKGLKLADLSIPPKNVSANTNNTAMVVGEKAADLIIQDLGL